MIRTLAIAFTLCAVWARIVARGEISGARALTGSVLGVGADVAVMYHDHVGTDALNGGGWAQPATLGLHPRR